MLMKEMAKLYDHTSAVKEELREELKEELTKDLKRYIDKKHQDTLDEIKFYNGKLQRDFVSAMGDQTSQFKDRADNHEIRITKVEHRLETAGIGV